jgi:hypothetical protein
MNPIWTSTQRTYIWVFNTERGLSVCIRLPNNLGMIYDLGCRDNFSPIQFMERNLIPFFTRLGEQSVAHMICSHPHHDHIQEASLVNQSSVIRNKLITLPHHLTVDGHLDERLDFSRIERDDNRDIIAEYRKLYEGRNPPLQTLDPNAVTLLNEDVVTGLYYMRPPAVSELHNNNDHHYGNGVSICLYIRHGFHSVWITGDITPEVHRHVIEGTQWVEKRFTSFSSSDNHNTFDYHTRTSSQPTPKQLFQQHGLSLLIAPHHGLESCFCQEMFDAIPGGKPILNVISEKRHTGENDGTVDVRYSDESHAAGCDVDIDGDKEFRRKVSTQNGHNMLFVLGGEEAQPSVYLRKDPLELLQIA